MGDYRTQQQQGWVTRAFGPVQATVLPSATSASERVVEVSCPDRPSEMGGLFLTSLLKASGCQWWMEDSALEGGGAGRSGAESVYRLLVGKAAIKDWVALPLNVMVNRIGYWPAEGRVVGVLGHPDSLLHPGKEKREKIHAATEFMREWGRVVRGETPAIELMGLDCIKCASEGVPSTYVTEIDQMGFGLCRAHGGWDARPEGQRWSQERMF